MFDYTKPARTKDGRKVRIICTDAKDDLGDYLVALVECANGEIIYTYSQDGVLIGDEKSSINLENIPEKHVRYFNCYSSLHSSETYESRLHADRGCAGTRTACIRVEFEDGQFDE